MKKKGKEISVKKAAESLNLSERTVINFIKQKKIEAIKVGRDWFVDRISERPSQERRSYGGNWNNAPANTGANIGFRCVFVPCPWIETRVKNSRARSERVMLFDLAFWPLGNFSLSLLGHAKESICSLLGAEKLAGDR